MRTIKIHSPNIRHKEHVYFCLKNENSVLVYLKRDHSTFKKWSGTLQLTTLVQQKTWSQSIYLVKNVGTSVDNSENACCYATLVPPLSSDEGPCLLFQPETIVAVLCFLWCYSSTCYS